MSRLVPFMCLMMLAAVAVAQQGPNLPPGERVFIRRYQQLEANPEGFELLPAEFTGENLDFSMDKLGGSGMLVITAADQNTTVATAIGSGFYTATYQDGKVASKNEPPSRLVTFRSFGIFGAARPLKVTFQDALGNPVAGASVEPIPFRVIPATPTPTDPKPAGPSLGKYQTDDKGVLELPWPSGNCDHYHYTITHPNYGTCRIPGYSYRMPVKMPLVPADSPARERALSGRILLPDGTPAAGAIIRVNDVRGLGSGSTQTGGFCLIADADGRFRGYPNFRDPRQNMGDLLPPGTTFFFRVKLPSDPRQPIVTFTGVNGTETDYKLERGNRLRRFVLEDEKGAINDPERLKLAALTIEGKDERSRIGYRWPEALAEHWFLPGTYQAQLQWPANVKFKPVTIDENTPDVVVMKAIQSASFEGRVINGSTSQPMSGAIVYAVIAHKSGVTRKRLDDVTHAEWEAIHKLPADLKANEPPLGPLGLVDEFSAVTRTGPDGRYRLTLNSGAQVFGILACEENFVAVRQNVRNKKAEGTVAVEDIALFPAATVTFTVVNNVERNLDFYPVWIIDQATVPPQWKDYFHPKQPVAGREFQYMDWMPTLADSKVTTFALHVPAGIKLGVSLTPRHDQWRPAHLPGPFQLAQGERRDLGAVEIKPAALVPVQVVGPQGEPVEGAPTFCGGGAVHNTDAFGTAVFFVEPGTKGEFEVRVKEGDKVVVSAKVPYECPADKTSIAPLTIMLTADQLAKIRESMQRQ